MANGPNQTRRLAGVANIAIDATVYDLVGDLEYMVSTVERKSLVGQDTVHGYSEMPIAGFISASVRDNGGFAVQGFNALTSSTVQSSLANGKSVVGTGMWCVSTNETKTMDGTFSIRFEGDNVTEVLA